MDCENLFLIMDLSQNVFLQGIMVFKYNCSNAGKQHLMATPTAETLLLLGFERSLARTDVVLKDLFEACFNCESHKAELCEILNEVVAKQNLSVSQARSEMTLLKKKLFRLSALRDIAKKDFFAFRRVFKKQKNVRKLKKAFKKFLASNNKYFDLMTEVSKDFWDYLPLNLQSAIENVAYSMFKIKVSEQVNMTFMMITKKYYRLRQLSNLEWLILGYYMGVTDFVDTVIQKITLDFSENKDFIDETDYLFSSKKNSELLIDSIERSKTSTTPPMTLSELYQQVNFCG